jgi:hypothetical protein
MPSSTYMAEKDDSSSSRADEAEGRDDEDICEGREGTESGRWGVRAREGAEQREEEGEGGIHGACLTLFRRACMRMSGALQCRKVSEAGSVRASNTCPDTNTSHIRRPARPTLFVAHTRCGMLSGLCARAVSHALRCGSLPLTSVAPMGPSRPTLLDSVTYVMDQPNDDTAARTNRNTRTSLVNKLHGTGLSS